MAGLRRGARVVAPAPEQAVCRRRAAAAQPRTVHPRGGRREDRQPCRRDIGGRHRAAVRLHLPRSGHSRVHARIVRSAAGAHRQGGAARPGVLRPARTIRRGSCWTTSRTPPSVRRNAEAYRRGLRDNRRGGSIDQVCADFGIDLAVFESADRSHPGVRRARSSRRRRRRWTPTSARRARRRGVRSRSRDRAFAAARPAGRTRRPVRGPRFVETLWADHLAAIAREHGDRQPVVAHGARDARRPAVEHCRQGAQCRRRRACRG